MPSTSPSKDYEKKKSDPILSSCSYSQATFLCWFCSSSSSSIQRIRGVFKSLSPAWDFSLCFFFLVTFPTVASFFLYILEPVRAPSLFVYCSFSVTRLFVRTFLSTFFSSDFRSWVFTWLSFAIRYRRRRHYSPKS